MIKKLKITRILFILICLFVVGCQTPNVNNPTDDDTIEINPKQEVVTIKDSDIEGYDFTTLFNIVVNGHRVPVKSEYIDSSSIKTIPGTYYVSCNYKEEIGIVEVRVITTVYRLELLQSSVTIKLSELANYDFLKLFNATIDGANTEIDQSMVTSYIEPKAGEYNYTVDFYGIVKTLKVVIEDFDITEIISAYRSIDLTIDELKNYDLTSLFSIYVNYAQIEVTADMIDTSILDNVLVGESYNLTISYQYKYSSIIINVVEEDEVKITSKNIFTYPSSEYIDLTTLFTIKKGEKEIPVTLDMISGSIDYSKIGVNEITLNYEGQTVTSTVEVKRGVIIDYAKSDTVIVVKGTNKDSYPFINDFKVYINGILFENINESYLNVEDVNFNEVGTYQAKITIPYNDNKLGLTSVKFTYYEKTINYVVVNNDYSINVLNELVTLPKGTTSYKVYSNLNVLINNRKQALTENKNYVDVITCYVETLSEPIDFTKVGLQEIKIAVYVNGVDADPVIVSYNVIIESDIVITTTNKVIFTNDNLYPTQLFTIKDGNKEVEVSLDMIEGTLNVFKAGKYTLTISYKGMKASANVIVFDSFLKGTYKTQLDNVNNYSGSTDEEYGETTVVTQVTDLIIDQDGNISFNGHKAQIISAIDEKTMLLKYLSYEYTLYYDNGIIVLIPDNAIKLGYSYDKRPFIYFNEEIWSIQNKVVINFSDDHVLNKNYTTYSIDTFNIKNKITNENIWYAFKINLIEKTSSDTTYYITYGECFYDESFKMESECKSSLLFNNDTYNFTMISEKVGKVSVDTNKRQYANLTFTGTIDGKPSELRADQFEGYSLYINSKLIFNASSYDISNMNNGGSDYINKNVLVYEFKDDLYSYKFSVNPDKLTFELIERDIYYGYYESDGMFLFLDGYGTGEINFNTKSYYKYPFKYTVYGDTIKLEFITNNPLFKYGKQATLYINPLLNVITVIDADYDVIEGSVFENSVITNGAIIKISSYKVGQDSDAVAKTKFLNNIEIITKDGLLEGSTKQSMIDLSRIKFSTPGFYQFTITVDLNGEQRVVYYGMEVLEIIYEGNPIVGAYGEGVLNKQNSLLIDKYGQAIIDCNGDIYRGSTKIFDDYSFTINAKNIEGKEININGDMITNGIVQIRCNGDYSFSDYFTLGKVNIIGTSNFVLREFVINNNITYILSNAATARGEVVEVETISGSSPSQIGAIIKVITNTTEYIIKVVSWDNINNGLIISDGYRGSYTNDQLVVELDGFGNSLINGVKGTYNLNGNVATITSNNETKVYKLNNNDYTFEIMDIKLDNSLMSGKTFTATHTFNCGYGIYYAETTFVFGENGVVTVISTSDDHDNGDNACTDDQYNPTFASKSGVKGTYSVNGNKVIINVADTEIVLIIVNVLKANEIKCESTTISSDAHGHISSGTLFIKK